MVFQELQRVLELFRWIFILKTIDSAFIYDYKIYRNRMGLSLRWEASPVEAIIIAFGEC